MKKIELIVIMVLSLFLLTGCVDKTTDAYKFKTEYESINNKDNGHGNKYRKLNIPNDNPFVYQTTEDIVERVKNKETFIVYFGFKECPWCRSIIEELIKAAKDKNIDTIYYVDVKDIRDVKEVDDNGNIITTKEGDKDYLVLVENFNEVLSDYNLTKDGITYNTGEKRIYAPNIVVVSNGKAVQMEEGTPKSLKDPYSKLTNKQKKYMYNKFKCIMTCFEQEQTTCKKDMC
jgi:thiol-disulfide isomerase/thioredoxin